MEEIRSFPCRHGLEERDLRTGRKGKGAPRFAFSSLEDRDSSAAKVKVEKKGVEKRPASDRENKIGYSAQ